MLPGRARIGAAGRAPSLTRSRWGFTYNFPGGGSEARYHRRRRLRGHARSSREHSTLARTWPSSSKIHPTACSGAAEGRHQRGARKRLEDDPEKRAFDTVKGSDPRRPGRDRGSLRRSAGRRLPARALGRRLLADGGRPDRATPFGAAGELPDGLRRRHAVRSRPRPLRADDETGRHDVQKSGSPGGWSRTTVAARRDLRTSTTAASSSSAPRP